MIVIPPMLHPAASLFAWFVFALALRRFPLALLIPLALLALVGALYFASSRCLSLLRRTRWLLVTLVVLYLFVTPGEYLPGIAGTLGMSFEGLHQGGEQACRLLLLLTTLALVHERLGTQGLLAGLFVLLRPLPWREATVVRLMLILDYADQARPSDWRTWLAPTGSEPIGDVETHSLAMPALRFRDGLLMTSLLIALLVMAFSR